MELRPPAVAELVDHLRRLPGVGPRTANQLVEHLLTSPAAEVAGLAAALAGLHERVGLCRICSLLSEHETCRVCTDPSRDRATILVIEEPTTAWAVEATGEYRGLYHALLGHLSPLHGIGPDDLTIEALLARCSSDEVTEVILATDPTVEGETTAHYLARRLESLGVTVTRPASGIPVGGEVAAADRVTLAQALELRRRL